MSKNTLRIFSFLFIFITIAHIFYSYTLCFEKKLWIIGSDGLSNYAYLRSLHFDHDLNFYNEFTCFNPFNNAVGNPEGRTKTGLVPNRYAIGSAILWLPFFNIAHILTNVSRLFGNNILVNGYSFFYQYFIGFGSLFYGLIGFIFIYHFLRYFFDEIISVIATISIIFGTNVYYYIIQESSMSHINSMFMVSLFMYFLYNFRRKQDVYKYILLGFIAGMMTLVRWQDIMFIGIFLVIFIRDIFTGNKLLETFFKGLIFILAFLLVFMVQIIAWKVIYGSYLIIPQGEGFMSLFRPQFYNVLFSSKHGLFSWTPLILFSIIGLFYFMVKTDNYTGGMMFAVFILQLYINSIIWDWWCGHSYGSRRFIDCSIIFATGLAGLLQYMKRWVKLKYMVIFLLVFILWNQLLIVQYSEFYVGREGKLSLSENLSNDVLIIRKIFIKK